MKVLITGGSGMLGHHLVNNVKANEFELFAPTRSDLDLLNERHTHEYIATLKPNIVIHAAGFVGGIDLNIKQQAKFLHVNSVMGLNVLRASETARVDSVINIGSSCMYPRNAPNPLQESSLLSGALEPTNEGYALAKLAVSKFGQLLRMQSKTSDFVTLIPCNLYGPNDHFELERSHLLAAIIKKVDDAIASRASQIEIWGTGKARREFLFVEDLADCIWSLVNEGVSSVPDFVNVGPGFDLSVTEYYEKVAAILGYDGGFYHQLSKPEGMPQKLMDSGWIYNWGWSPKTPLELGIEKTYEYFKTIRPQ